jgi:hypothetical protein
LDILTLFNIVMPSEWMATNPQELEKEMKSWKYFPFVLGLSLSGLQNFVSAVPARAAPKELYGKTVRVQWAESMLERAPDGRTIAPTVRHERTIYISSAGRTFVASRASSPGGETKRLGGPGDGGAGSWGFQGNVLVGTFANGAVARRVSVSFDPSGTGCTASVIVGKTGNAKWTGVDGVVYELMQDNVGSSTCSVEQGNAFGEH